MNCLIFMFVRSYGLGKYIFLRVHRKDTEGSDLASTENHGHNCQGMCPEISYASSKPLLHDYRGTHFTGFLFAYEYHGEINTDRCVHE